MLMFMKNVLITLLLLIFCDHTVQAISISPDEARKIAEKIWKNECGGTLEGLTSWNKGENFGSFGIGHFIWFPKDNQERFQETFPGLLTFLQSEKIHLPDWLKSAQGCPWTSRENFYSHVSSPEMNELRQLLYDTRNLQAIYIANRLEKALPQMIANLKDGEKKKVSFVFSRLLNDPNGLYAMIDYLNFKGEGTSPQEGYKGKGWGLLQVLQKLSPNSQDIVKDFMESAKKVLTLRVANSPPERNEKQWLKGWFNRIETYKESPVP